MQVGDCVSSETDDVVCEIKRKYGKYSPNKGVAKINKTRLNSLVFID